MKTRHLIILLAVVAVLGAIALLKEKRRNSDWHENRSEDAITMLGRDFDASGIFYVSIKDQGRSITMRKDADGWKLQDKHGYPANFQDLARLVSDLSETKIAQSLPASGSQMDDLMLTDEAGAVTLSLSDKDGKVLKTFVFGKKVESTGGQDEQAQQMAMYGMGGNIPLGRFVKMDDGACVVANTFSMVDQPVTDWFDSEFIKVSSLKSATLSRDGKPLWTLDRDSSTADLRLLGEIPAGKEEDKSRISSMRNAFSWIKFNDVAPNDADPASIGMTSPSMLTLTEFNGNIYKIKIGEPVEGKQYIKITAEWNGATERQAAEDEKPEDKAKLDTAFQKSVKDYRDTMARLNAKLQPWYYEVGSQALSAIRPDFADFLKDIPKEEPKKEEKAE